MAIDQLRRQKSRQDGNGTVFTFPAPTGGLNLRDDISSLPPNKARELKNWLPDVGVMKPRKGYVSQSEDVGTGPVNTVAVFEGAASRVPIAVADGEIWDISGTTASSIHDGSYSNNNFVTANFNGYIIGVNGSETPWRYDGSSHSATGFTGPTIANLATIAVVRGRLWFALTDSATAYYGGLGAVTGALTSFNVGEIADGGRVQAVCSWSRDSGDGADDVTVFIMNTGQLIVYEGDPASTFSLIGKYKAPPPIGRRCWVKVGGDVILITRMGFLPLSAVVSGAVGTEGGSAASSIPVWGEVAPGVTADAIAYGALDGWMGIFWNGLVIFNVPILAGTSKQYVLNTRNNAWTTFDYPAVDFADFNGMLLFGALAGGDVRKISGPHDNGMDIELISRSGYVRSPNNKNWRATMIRPYLAGDGAVSAIIDIDMNYEGRPFSGDLELLLQGAAGGDWDDDWGVDWSGGFSVYNRWQSVKGLGSSMAVIAKMQTQAETVTWNQTQVMVKPAGNR